MNYNAEQIKQNPSFASDLADANELKIKIEEAIESLPEQCRLIFRLSRFEELKYAEIASQLGISIKTVENQMGKALKVLRLKLADYLVLWLILCFF
jgi:RNA polymerase sigma-70 factor (ECF subfamily)